MNYVLNIPNLLSLLRLMLVPFFPIAYHVDAPYAPYLAVGVYVLAACTDVVDGWIARRTKQITKLGRILDPLADKSMAFVVLLTITLAGVVDWWAVAVLFVKEITMAIGALTLFRKENDIFAAVKVGKSATVIFFFVCVTLTLFHKIIPTLWSNVLLAVAVGFNVAALFCYLQKYITHIKGKKTNL